MALSVNQPSDAALAMQDGLAKMAALEGGTTAMRAAGRQYLPQFPLESDESYKYRLAVSTLFNATGWTLKNLAGKPFTEAVRWPDGTPEPIVDWFANLDLCGHDLQNFAHLAFSKALRDGLTHVLVDYPVTRAEDGSQAIRTVAEEKAAGVRPYTVLIEQSQVLGWISSTRDGAEYLEQFRFMERVDEPDGPFGTKKVKQVRVLYPGRWEKYRHDAQTDRWALTDEGTTTLDFIPLVTAYTNRTGYLTAKPPLDDLAELNIKHWQSSSDQDSLLHTARVPLLVRIGVNGDDSGTPTQIGKSVTDLPTDADMKYVEHSGAAIGAGRDSLKDLESQMEAMGAEMLTVRPGNKTATQSAIESSEQQSQLGQMVENFEQFLDQVIAKMGAWVGLEFAGGIDIFNDFATIDITSQTVLPVTSAITSLVNLGLLDDQAAFEELKRYGIINPELSFADVQARIAIQAPRLLA